MGNVRNTTNDTLSLREKIELEKLCQELRKK